VDWLKVSEIASETNIHDNTIRRYIKLFPSYFTRKQFGKTAKYGRGAVELVKAISTAYGSGQGTEEIREMLKTQLPQVFDVAEEQPSHNLTTIPPPLKAIESLLEANRQATREDLQALKREIVEEVLEGMRKEKKPLIRRFVDWWRG